MTLKQYESPTEMTDVMPLTDGKTRSTTSAAPYPKTTQNQRTMSGVLLSPDERGWATTTKALFWNS